MPLSRPLFVALFVLALGCNAFDDPPDGVDDDFGTVPPSVAPPSRPMQPQQVPPMPGSAPAVGVGGMATAPCTTCGAFCSDCGLGCICEEGHSPFEAPSWHVPFTPTGELGWRDSSTALCAGFESVLGVNLWGDGSSVYAMVAGGRVSPGADEVLGEDDAGVERVSSGILSGSRTRVLHNEGGGWTLRADLPGSWSRTRRLAWPTG